MTTAVATRKPLTRIRLIGFIAMGVCAIGYAGFALALLAGKLDYLPMTQAAIIAAVGRRGLPGPDPVQEAQGPVRQGDGPQGRAFGGLT